MKNNTIKKIPKKSKFSEIATVRFTPTQMEMINASSRINKCNRSTVLQQAVNEYFNINQ